MSRRTDLQTNVGVFHTLVRQAGDGEDLAVVLKIDLACCSRLGPADLVNASKYINLDIIAIITSIKKKHYNLKKNLHK